MALFLPECDVITMTLWGERYNLSNCIYLNCFTSYSHLLWVRIVAWIILLFILCICLSSFCSDNIKYIIWVTNQFAYASFSDVSYIFLFMMLFWADIFVFIYLCIYLFIQSITVPILTYVNLNFWSATVPIVIY